MSFFCQIKMMRSTRLMTEYFIKNQIEIALIYSHLNSSVRFVREIYLTMNEIKLGLELAVFRFFFL